MTSFASSLLDKLLATDASGLEEGFAPRMTIEQVKESVARDLETLLNTRPPLASADLWRYPQAARSPLAYGLVDITSLAIASDRDRSRITEAIRRSLADHEQRLTQVEVTVSDTARVGGGLRFVIRARLRLAPASEPVAFDAVLQPGPNRYAVSRHRAPPAPSA